MPRQIIQVHTIEQWLALDAGTQATILANIRLKERLHIFLKQEQAQQNQRKLLHRNEDKAPTWKPCPTCNRKNATPPAEKGWILEHPRYDGIHPSRFGEPCLLKIYNEMTGVPSQEKFEPRKQLIFDFGTALHGVFQGYGVKGAWGPMYEPEVLINRELQQLADDLMLEGAADAENVLILDDIPNYPHIIEIGLIHEYKSINDNGFKALRKPQPKHQFQATLYSAARNRPITVYLYMNKNDSNLLDFPIPFDGYRWNTMYTRGKLLVDHYDRQVPPPAETGFHCQECGWFYGCEPAKAAARLVSLNRQRT